MPEFPPLESFGNRIMICGPSSAGKSTLAVALGKKLGVPAIHLDLLFHRHGTHWQPRPLSEFEQLHAEAIAGDAWTIEGNYSRLFPQRLARATGILFIGSDRWSTFGRYVRRTLFERERPGGLPGGRDRITWSFSHYVLVVQPRNRDRDRASLQASRLPMLETSSLGETRRLYAEWGLSRG